MGYRVNICPFICFFISIPVFVGFVFFVFAIVFDNSGAKFHVVNASLTQFNVTTTTDNKNILSYNLTLGVNLRNPSRMIGIRYRRIRATATYKSKMFDLITFPPFYQGHKNSSILRPVFQGQALVKFLKSELKGFNKDQTRGSFGITISFYLDLTLKLGSLKFRGVPTIFCDLKPPLGSYNGTTSVGRFKTMRCYKKLVDD